jgi:hypothetical protein
MDNVLQDMVQRLRAIELLLRTRVLAELEQNRRYAEASKVEGVLPAPAEVVPSRLIGEVGAAVRALAFSSEGDAHNGAADIQSDLNSRTFNRS